MKPIQPVTAAQILDYCAACTVEAAVRLAAQHNRDTAGITWAIVGGRVVYKGRP